MLISNAHSCSFQRHLLQEISLEKGSFPACAAFTILLLEFWTIRWGKWVLVTAQHCWLWIYLGLGRSSGVSQGIHSQGIPGCAPVCQDLSLPLVFLLSFPLILGSFVGAGRRHSFTEPEFQNSPLLCQNSGVFLHFVRIPGFSLILLGFPGFSSLSLELDLLGLSHL